MSPFASEREERRQRLEQLVLAERAEAYGAAFRAGVAMSDPATVLPRALALVDQIAGGA